MSLSHLSETTFESLNLAPALSQGLYDAGFTHCTPIQAQTLPDTLQEHDVAGQAQTGTGKTIAFLLATFQHIMTQDKPEESKSVRALILAPTRELAIQIHKDAQLIGKHTGIQLGLAYGGTDYQRQRDVIAAGVDILIGTPGRIIDYFKQQVFSLKHTEVLVLDEADRMFDLGFIKDIRFLLRRMPKPGFRLSMLFSATLSFRITELAYEHMNNPKLIRIEPEKITSHLLQEAVYYPGNLEKTPLLIGLLHDMKPSRCLIFVNTKQVAERTQAHLKGNDFDCAMLSGDVPQKKRQRLLDDFQQGRLHILIATDVAARGLHIPDVSHVLNYDLPQDAEDYVHRIGRTARAGASGVAISFACEEYAYSLPDIEEYIGHKIPRQEILPELLPEIKPAKRNPRRKPQHHRNNRGGIKKHRRREPGKKLGVKTLS